MQSLDILSFKVHMKVSQTGFNGLKTHVKRNKIKITHMLLSLISLWGKNVTKICRTVYIFHPYVMLRNTQMCSSPTDKKTPTSHHITSKIKHRGSLCEQWIHPHTPTHTHTYMGKKGKGMRLALLREKVSMAASSSWSQTELLSRPRRISQEEQQEGREAAGAGGG